jgi:hypothetical protein
MMIALFFLYLILAICFGVLIFQLNDFTRMGKYVVPTVGGLLWPILAMIFIAVGLAMMISTRVLPARHDDFDL